MLDEQNGITEGHPGKAILSGGVSGSGRGTRHGIYQNGYGGLASVGYADTGGASRFFKQVGGAKAKGVRPLISRDKQIGGEHDGNLAPSLLEQEDNMTTQNPPGEMVEYLLTLISPPGERALYWDCLDVNWEAFEDNSVCGLIVRGTPTEKQSAKLLRILKPGGHLLLIAPDEEPTGHTGACHIEDAGFEIRDAILWVREPGRIHYVPKASRSEREAGCGLLEGKTGAQAVERQEGTDGLNSPRAGAGRTAKHIKNPHPCLHPDAPVMTERGYRPVSEIQIGQRVYSADGRFHDVTDVSYHKHTTTHLRRISVMGTNYTEDVTGNHPFLIWRPVRKGKAIIGGGVDWLGAQELQKGDYTMTPILAEPQKPAANVPSDENFWFLFGLWIAEGIAQSAGRGPNVYPSYTLNQDELDLIGRIQEYFGKDRVSIYPKKESSAVQVVAFCPKEGGLFVDLGGRGASTKSIHPLIWSLPRNLRSNLFKGYMAGDGGEVRTYEQAKTVSPDLASQFRLLGESIGYKANLYWYKAEPGEIQGRKFKKTLPYHQIRFYNRNGNHTNRKPSCPTFLKYGNTTYRLSYVQSVERVPYTGEVVNLTVHGSPTFQTAVGVSHNTVKPYKIMERILQNIPKDQGPVLDPFVGSGSTAIACLKTGHDCIGIDQEHDYLKIADARVRFWEGETRSVRGWRQPDIQSDANSIPTPPAEPMDMFDLFYGGDK
jgi:DNA modification methylase